MVVSISYDPAANDRDGGWVVNKKLGRTFLNLGVDSQSTHREQSAGISDARRMADTGERIVLNEKSGGQRVIRQG